MDFSEKDILDSIGQTQTILAARYRVINNLLQESITELSEFELQQVCQMPIFKNAYRVIKTIEGMSQALASSGDPERYKSGKVLYLEAVCQSENVKLSALQETEEALQYVYLRKARLERLKEKFQDFRKKQR